MRELFRKRHPRPHLPALPADTDTQTLNPSDKVRIQHELDDLRYRVAILEAEVGIYTQRENYDHPYR